MLRFDTSFGVALLALIFTTLIHTAPASGDEGGLLLYDAFVQSGYHSDRQFGVSLLDGCGMGESAELKTGICVWAGGGARISKHEKTLNWNEDAYTFNGGVQFPLPWAAVTFGIGYEILDFDLDVAGRGTATKADADASRYLAAITAAFPVANIVDADFRISLTQTEWDMTRSETGNRYRGLNDVRTWAAVGAVQRAFGDDRFSFAPRFETGVVYLALDGLGEVTLAGSDDAALSVDNSGHAVVYIAPSFSAYHSITSFMETLISVSANFGADIVIFPAKSNLRGEVDGSRLRTKGTLERVMFDYGLGVSAVHFWKGRMEFRLDYDGGISKSLDTVVNSLTAKFNFAF